MEIPTADVAPSESAQSEAEIWDELDSGSTPSEEQVDATDGAEANQDSPVPDDGDDSPENLSQGEDAQRTDESVDEEFDDAIDQALEEDLGGGEEEDTTEEDETDEGSDQETHDEIQVAQKQVEDAKKRMHQATMEASDLRRSNEQMQTEMQQLQEKLSSMQQAIDSGEAKTSREARMAQVMDNLSDEQKEAFELYPEIMDVVLAITSGDKSGPSSKSETPAGDETQGQSEDSQTDMEAVRSWQDAVIEMEPNFFELINTDEWKDYTKQCQRTVNAVMENYDQYDPRGAKQLYRGFNAWKERGSKPSPKTVKTPKSKSVSSQRRGAPVRTREQEESEIWDEVTGVK